MATASVTMSHPSNASRSSPGSNKSFALLGRPTADASHPRIKCTHTTALANDSRAANARMSGLCKYLTAYTTITDGAGCSRSITAFETRAKTSSMECFVKSTSSVVTRSSTPCCSANASHLAKPFLSLSMATTRQPRLAAQTASRPAPEPKSTHVARLDDVVHASPSVSRSTLGSHVASSGLGLHNLKRSRAHAMPWPHSRRTTCTRTSSAAAHASKNASSPTKHASSIHGTPLKS
mmetsp:Transcript_205/g.868  ORF Transcript_205/g.868 Transcript_205/m.868 type:complete len:236 (-) Transcript_205:289-996(-)